MKKERGKVWLGAGGIVINSNGEWLVVKKRYSGLKGVWSMPAGFVEVGETADEAVIREIKEETGIDCEVTGLIGFRSGVLRGEISDNMAIFYCKPIDENQPFVIQEEELYDACWAKVEDLVYGGEASIMLQEMACHNIAHHQLCKSEINPGDIFQYSSYKLFYNK